MDNRDFHQNIFMDQNASSSVLTHNADIKLLKAQVVATKEFFNETKAENNIFCRATPITYRGEDARFNSVHNTELPYIPSKNVRCTLSIP